MVYIYIHNGVYSAIKENEIMSSARKWTEWKSPCLVKQPSYTKTSIQVSHLWKQGGKQNKQNQGHKKGTTREVEEERK
jgi:hypothetical protein